MDINIPEKVRGLLYVGTGIGSIIVTYLAASHTIGINETAAWVAFTVFIAGLARFNLSATPDERR